MQTRRHLVDRAFNSSWVISKTELENTWLHSGHAAEFMAAYYRKLSWETRGYIVVMLLNSWLLLPETELGNTW